MALGSVLLLSLLSGLLLYQSLPAGNNMPRDMLTHALPDHYRPHYAPSSLSTSPLRNPTLTLTPARTFTIAIFTDLHFGEDEHTQWAIDQDVSSARAMRAILDHEPGVDFVVINGDLITGENTFRHNSTEYVARVVAPLVERGIPWASVYGNHDSSATLSREKLLEAERRAGGRLCFTDRQGENVAVDGVTNFFIPVFGKHSTGRYDDGEYGGRPALMMWFVDSRGGREYETDTLIEHWVSARTAAWLLSIHRGMMGLFAPLRAVPSLMFVHIPPKQILTGQHAIHHDDDHSDGNGKDGDGTYDKDTIKTTPFPGLNADVPATPQAGDGTLRQDGAFEETLRIMGMEGLHSVYTGHDHGNAWCSTWDGRARVKEEGEGEGEGPFLCFAKHSGYGGYGRWNRGGRIVRVRVDDYGNGYGNGEGVEVETWVRMEGGRVVTRVGLNATYGLDRYPVETGEGV